ncbi:unnamed protein product [Timema podura]|uniref:Ketosynthase family 3 (KS3) domain-containing protein n=1 Tax=Timema podura TaxID=61482 RepID=A0ABN7NHJ7_TIMPD|nr:unnamed protein product [Timema podura]
MAVIMGSQISESESVWIFLSNVENGFGILGHNRAMVANRVSYWFNCSGPSYSFYSAETAGIEGLTLAHEAIKKGYCETALVGTITFALHPELSYNLKELGVLSEDGCNRSFDDEANGIVRSEASVVMFLQKAKNAKRIYASIVHSQFDCYGDRKSGYAVPLEYPLTTLLSSFYQRCGIDPSLISYLEADGSGIKTLDATELNAVSKILLHNRQSPLLIGSIKSNVGHTDAAAALVSVVKVLIAMETGRIPPNHNFNKPSQQVPALVEGKLKVVTETMPWSGGLAAVNIVGLTGVVGDIVLLQVVTETMPWSGGLAAVNIVGLTGVVGHIVLLQVVTETMPWSGGLAAVNAVGLTGVVGHILLRSHSKEKVNGGLPTDELPRLLFISGRTEECLEETFSKIYKLNPLMKSITFTFTVQNTPFSLQVGCDMLHYGVLSLHVCNRSWKLSIFPPTLVDIRERIICGKDTHNWGNAGDIQVHSTSISEFFLHFRFLVMVRVSSVTITSTILFMYCLVFKLSKDAGNLWPCYDLSMSSPGLPFSPIAPPETFTQALFCSWLMVPGSGPLAYAKGSGIGEDLLQRMQSHY